MTAKPTNVCIINVFGSTNRGDAAIFASLVKVVKDTFARRNCAASVTALARYSAGMSWSKQLQDVSFHEPLFASYYTRRWVRRFFSLYIISLSMLWLAGFKRLAFLLMPERKRRSIEAVRASDYVLSCGGAFLDDSSPSFILNLIEIYLAKTMDKPVILVSQSIGPFRRPWARALAGRVLRKVDYVLPREKWTEDYVLAALGIARERVRLVPDLAFDSPSIPRQEALELLKKNGIDIGKTLVGVTVLKWVYPGAPDISSMHKRYTKGIAALCDYIAETHDAEIVFVPQYVSGPERGGDDMDVAAAVKGSALHQDRFHLLPRDMTPDAVKGVIGCMAVFVGTRMHSNIFALSQSVPAMAISYLPKTTYIMDALGLQDYVVDITQASFGRTQPVFDSLWANRANLRQHLDARIPEFQRRIADVLDVLFDAENELSLLNRQETLGGPHAGAQ
jgi:colanic acid/amylovoran biosynthesis protein